MGVKLLEHVWNAGADKVFFSREAKYACPHNLLRRMRSKEDRIGGEQECRVILPVPSRSKSTGLFLA
jgi:hypothetical protein